jgi:single-stranded-DNA-specific exonuclease
MKYKLIKPINPQYSTVEQILTNRGIPIQEIHHYLNTTDNDINSPSLFGEDNLKRGAAALINTIKSDNTMIIVVDADCDGFTSSAILINYLHDLFPYWVETKLSWYLHSSKQHGLNDCIDWIVDKQFNLVCCPDSSSNDYNEHQRLKELGIDTIVLDHHEADKIDDNAIIINNQLSSYPNKELSGAGVTWQFCRYIDKLLNTTHANNYLDLVSLGDNADMMSMTSFETKHLIQKGLEDENLKNPFITYMADKNSFSLKGKLTPINVAFYIAPYVNAIVRSGTLEEKQVVFESMLQFRAFERVPSTKRGHKLGDTESIIEQATRIATNVKARQTKAQNEGMLTIENMIQEQHLLDHKVLLFLIEAGAIDKNIAGLIANKIMSKYQRPVCILTKVNDEGTISYQGSARGCDKTGVNNFKDICSQTNAILYAEGHQGAFGLGIEEDKIQDFINRTDEILKDINDEPIYFVDYIYQSNTINPQNILNIADMDNLWGKDINEALVAVENIKVTSDMVTVYSKKNLTIKINLPNNISAMIFNASDEEVAKLQTNNTGYVEINLVAKCNRNEWMGNITPQLFIEDWEATDSNKYYF